MTLTIVVLLLSISFSGDHRVSIVLLVKISLKYINFAAELEDFMQILDQRHETKAKKDKGTMAKKARKVGTPSSAPPPSGAPAWTLKPTG